jgi:hypothetical protein
MSELMDIYKFLHLINKEQIFFINTHKPQKDGAYTSPK